jgi:uncharacterized protein (DUF302 family)
MNEPASVDGLRLVASSHPVPQVLDRLEKLARDKGLTVFSRIDFSGDAARAGLTQRPTGMTILGSPKGGTPLMLAAPTTAIDLPLKVLAWEEPDGRCWLAYNEPAYLQKRHGFPAELMRNIAALGALVDAAAAAS